MHAATDPRLILCLEGLGMSFAMLEHIYPGLHENCHKIKTESRPMSLALLKCWSFVDVVHRIREITETIPGLNTNTPQVRQFLQETQVAELFRNYIQHLRGELLKREPNNFPVWGSISWVDPDDQSLIHIVDSGTRIGTITNTSILYDTQRKKWVSSVSLNIEGGAFNFDLIYDAAIQFREFIIPWIFDTYKAPLTKLEGPNVSSIRFQVDIIRENQEEQLPPDKNTPPSK